MVSGRADARPVWSMRMARTAPDCGQMLGRCPRTSLSRVVDRNCRQFKKGFYAALRGREMRGQNGL